MADRLSFGSPDQGRTNWQRAAGAAGAVLLLLVVGMLSGRSVLGQPRATRSAASAAEARSLIDADDYDPGLFDASSDVVDNEWFPLVPGTKYVWKGHAFEDETGERVARKVVFIVTDLTKELDGVSAVVGWDRDFTDGEMNESEVIFYAQDKDGNVWHLGELVEHWDEGELDGARSWFFDSPEGARPGIQMLADPIEGAQYSQGFAPPPWFWDDNARVREVGVRDCVPVGCFDAIITEEFEPRFPGEIQLKYYGRGIGGTRVDWTGDDQERERMLLVRYEELAPDALARARERVMEQEARAYAYAQTPPAELRTT
jgi:hypothetical protein